MKKFKQFVRDYRGQEILDTCNGLKCTLKETIQCIKNAYKNYVKEWNDKS